MKEINESGYALFKRLGNLSDAHITEASVCPERKGMPAFWKSFAGIAGLAAALALVVGLTVLVRPTKIDPSAGNETAESESENAPGTWSGETEPDPEEEYACWFLYRSHKAVTETGLWYVSEYFDDPDKPGLDGDGNGLSFKLTEMEDAPTIRYDIHGPDKITYYEAGVETEKAFRLWDSDGFSTLDFGTDLYAYLYDHPGTYYLSCDRHVERKIDGGTKTAEYCEGVRLIAGDGVAPETVPVTEPGTEPETEPVTEPKTEPETEPELSKDWELLDGVLIYNGNEVSDGFAASFPYISLVKSLRVKAARIGENAFRGMPNLVDVVIESNATEIPAGCFENCVSLETVRSAAPITKFGPESFKNCVSLRTLPSFGLLEAVGKDAFLNCYAENIPPLFGDNGTLVLWDFDREKASSGEEIPCIEGEGCLTCLLDGSEGYKVFWNIRTDSYDLTGSDAVGFWFYVSDLRFFDCVEPQGQIELTSSGYCDNEETAWNVIDLRKYIVGTPHVGWNLVRLDLTEAKKTGVTDWSRVNFFRCWFHEYSELKGITIAFDMLYAHSSAYVSELSYIPDHKVPAIIDVADIGAEIFIRDYLESGTYFGTPAFNVERIAKERMETGTVGLDDGYELWYYNYRLQYAGDTGKIVTAETDIFSLFYYEDKGPEVICTPICYIEPDTLRKQFGTEEMLAKYGNPYTAAAVELPILYQGENFLPIHGFNNAAK